MFMTGILKNYQQDVEVILVDCSYFNRSQEDKMVI